MFGKEVTVQRREEQDQSNVKEERVEQVDIHSEIESTNTMNKNKSSKGSGSSPFIQSKNKFWNVLKSKVKNKIKLTNNQRPKKHKIK